MRLYHKINIGAGQPTIFGTGEYEGVSVCDLKFINIEGRITTDLSFSMDGSISSCSSVSLNDKDET